MLVLDGGCEGGDFGIPRHVDRNVRCIATGGGDFLRNGLRACLVDVGDDDEVSVFGEPFRGGPSDSAASTRDYDDALPAHVAFLRVSANVRARRTGGTGPSDGSRSS